MKTFREYLAVHPDACAGMGGHAMDDMALDLARIALNFATPAASAQEHTIQLAGRHPIEALLAGNLYHKVNNLLTPIGMEGSVDETHFHESHDWSVRFAPRVEAEVCRKPTP